MPEEKAEKLKHDQNGWDSGVPQFVIDMFCHFAEGVGVYKALTEMKIYKKEKVPNPDKVKGEAVVKKVPGAGGPTGYVRIEPTYIPWNPGDYTGEVKTIGTIKLLGPGGTLIGEPVKFEDKVVID